MGDRKDHGRNNAAAKVVQFQVGWYLVTTDAQGKNPAYSFQGNGDKPTIAESRTHKVRFFYGQRWHMSRPASVKDYRKINRQAARKR